MTEDITLFTDDTLPLKVFYGEKEIMSSSKTGYRYLNTAGTMLAENIRIEYGDPVIGCVEFYSSTEFSIRVDNAPPGLYYNAPARGADWTEFTEGSGNIYAWKDDDGEYRLRLRGEDISELDGDMTGVRILVNGNGLVSVRGNISSLLDYRVRKGLGNFSALFHSNGCQLSGTPFLDISTLIGQCYYSTFKSVSFYNDGAPLVIDLTCVKNAKVGSLTFMAPASTALVPVIYRFGRILSDVGFVFGSSISALLYPSTLNIEFEHGASDTPKFHLSNMLKQGVSKFTLTYNIYTDNLTLKTEALALADTYTTVNVYKLNGGPWT